MGVSGVHAVHSINGLAGSRLILSTCVYCRGSLCLRAGRRKIAAQVVGTAKTRGAEPSANRGLLLTRRFMVRILPEDPNALRLRDSLCASG